MVTANVVTATNEKPGLLRRDLAPKRRTLNTRLAFLVRIYA
jgi:hypothetical protein